MVKLDRCMMVLGANFGAIRTEILILLIFDLIALIISVPIFKRVITK